MEIPVERKTNYSPGMRVNAQVVLATHTFGAQKATHPPWTVAFLPVCLALQRAIELG